MSLPGETEAGQRGDESMPRDSPVASSIEVMNRVPVHVLPKPHRIGRLVCLKNSRSGENSRLAFSPTNG